MKAQFILAAVLSLATVSAMADSHYKHHKHHRSDKVTVVHHYHQTPRHHTVQPRRVAPPPRYVRYHRPHAPRYVVQQRPVVVAPTPQVYYTPPRPVPLRPTANFSLSVNL
ncbi:MAG: hypothetical protein IKI11_10460 [Neisseriaceae bacterium]|nr:hypothetical protein [Neisseriaceae bacterium]